MNNSYDQLVNHDHNVDYALQELQPVDGREELDPWNVGFTYTELRPAGFDGMELLQPTPLRVSTSGAQPEEKELFPTETWLRMENDNSVYYQQVEEERKNNQVSSTTTAEVQEDPNKPHSCSTCGKAFSKRYQLKDHLIVHSDVKPFKCDLCSYDTKWKHHLKNHKRMKHSSTEMPEGVTRPNLEGINKQTNEVSTRSTTPVPIIHNSLTTLLTSLPKSPSHSSDKIPIVSLGPKCSTLDFNEDCNGAETSGKSLKFTGGREKTQSEDIGKTCFSVLENPESSSMINNPLVNNPNKLITNVGTSNCSASNSYVCATNVPNDHDINVEHSSNSNPSCGKDHSTSIAPSTTTNHVDYDVERVAESMDDETKRAVESISFGETILPTESYNTIEADGNNVDGSNINEDGSNINEDGSNINEDGSNINEDGSNINEDVSNINEAVSNLNEEILNPNEDVSNTINNNVSNDECVVATATNDMVSNSSAEHSLHEDFSSNFVVNKKPKLSGNDLLEACLMSAIDESDCNGLIPDDGDCQGDS